MATATRQSIHSNLSLGAVAGAHAAQNTAIDASGDKVAYIFQMPEAATITHLGFRYGARTGTPPTYRVSVQGVGATGAPDGTVLGGGSPASATFTPPADATWNGTWRKIALDNSIVVARGDWVAVVIDYSSGSVDGSNNSSFTNSWSTSCVWGAPYATIDTTGSYVKQTNKPAFALYSASAVYGFPMESLFNTSIATTNHRQALKFTLPSGHGDTFKVVGARMVVAVPATGGTIIFGLWDAAGAVIQDVTIDSDYNTNPGGAVRHVEWYFNEVALTALSFGTAYYLGVQQTSGGSTCILYGEGVDTATELLAMPGGDTFHLATWNGSAWADDQTVVPFVELILDDITEPAAGGGSAPQPNLLGGILQ